MNKAILMGRLTKSPELKSTQSGIYFCNFTVAINRRFKNKDGEYDADFINCVSWRNTSEFITKYFGKGDMIAAVGTIQTRNYENDKGEKVYITEVVVDEAYFCGSKQSKGDTNQQYMPPTDEDLPFDL